MPRKPSPKTKADDSRAIVVVAREQDDALLRSERKDSQDSQGSQGTSRNCNGVAAASTHGDVPPSDSPYDLRFPEFLKWAVEDAAGSFWEFVRRLRGYFTPGVTAEQVFDEVRPYISQWGGWDKYWGESEDPSLQRYEGIVEDDEVALTLMIEYWEKIRFVPNGQGPLEQALASERQNRPLKTDDSEAQMITREVVMAKTVGIARGTVPTWAHTLTAMIDVHGELLYWLVLGCGDGFRCHVVDYGVWPQQRRPQFLLREANPGLTDITPGGQEAAIRAGLDAIAAGVLCREFRREDGAAVRVRRSMVDANWGQQTDTVYEWCRICPQQPMPSHGKYLGAASPLWTDRRPESGERNGPHWRIPNLRQTKRAQPHMIYDTNFWKSFVAARLLAPIGGAGSMELHGQPVDHELLIQHWLSEQCIAVTARNRTIHEWKLPQPIDNHWFDCIVGACVAASRCGISERTSQQQRGPRRRPKVKYF